MQSLQLGLPLCLFESLGLAFEVLDELSNTKIEHDVLGSTWNANARGFAVNS